MALGQTLGAAALLLLLLPAGEALAYAPRDLGSFQIQCVAQGGTFGLGRTASTYECGYLDGSIETCNFDLTDPVCLTRSGRSHRSPGDTGTTGPVATRKAPLPAAETSP